MRRLTRRIYIPLPDEPAREAIIGSKLAKVNNSFSDEDMKKVIKITDGYSCADM